MSIAEGMSTTAILSASRISKSFGEVPVLFSIDFDIRIDIEKAQQLLKQERGTEIDKKKRQKLRQAAKNCRVNIARQPHRGFA